MEASVLREMMQPLWDTLKEGGMTKETEELAKFFMDEAMEAMKEEKRLEEKTVMLNIEKARLEGHRDATMRFMEAFLNSVKKATTKIQAQ